MGVETDFELIMSRVDDGDLFEEFAQDLMCQVKGQDFVPVGGIHDRGIDGLERCHAPQGVAQTIYQFSIEKDARSKIRKTLTSLRNAGVVCQRFFYVTNRRIKDQDKIDEAMFESFGVVTKCHDVLWLRGHVNETEGSRRTYLTFVESRVHSFERRGPDPIVADFDRDPRIFVYLRHQIENSDEQARLDHSLVDSLILLALEGTDPDKRILRTRDEIAKEIRTRAKQLPSFVEDLLESRLRILSSKPLRRVHHHSSESGYCLPYETRIELVEKQAAVQALFEAFQQGAKQRVTELLVDTEMDADKVTNLLMVVVNTLFKKQGFAFAEFLSSEGESSTVETALGDIISATVDESSTEPGDRAVAKRVLLSVIRGLVYQGTDDELAFLRKLANSYMMLFLMQCDPSIAMYFSLMAGKLRVFVGNSILVPALSELPLDSKHRRHWNLLMSANQAGVRMMVNRATVSELCSHVRGAMEDYETFYEGNEHFYETDEAIAYIDQILIRSYFYSLKTGQDESFRAYIDRFASPGSVSEEMEMIIWLKATFGIEFVERAPKGVTLNSDDVDALASELERHKRSRRQAANDAETALTVYATRAHFNEDAEADVWGYKTWWLSKDTHTQRAARRIDPAKSRVACCMRPEFLYNYICLAPGRAQSEEVFDVMFPSVLGASISQHVPQDIADAVKAGVVKHRSVPKERMRAKLAALSFKLQTDAKLSGKQVTHFLDEEFSAITAGDRPDR